MHKFLRAAGFSMYQKKKDIEKLLDLLETQPSVTKCVQIDEETNVCEMRTEIAPGIGLSIVGELNEEGDFEREFYFPYVECAQESSTAECSVQRHVEKETYAGMVDESCVGISLIFYVQNFLDYLHRRSGDRRQNRKSRTPRRAVPPHPRGDSPHGLLSRTTGQTRSHFDPRTSDR